MSTRKEPLDEKELLLKRKLRDSKRAGQTAVIQASRHMEKVDQLKADLDEANSIIATQEEEIAILRSQRDALLRRVESDRVNPCTCGKK